MAINVAGSLLANRPTSPAVLFQNANGALECQKLDVNVEFHVSTAFVNIKGIWLNREARVDCLFVLPLLGTMTNINVRVGPARRVESRLVSNEDAERMARSFPKDDEDPGQETIPQQLAYDQYIPNLFRFPINDVEPNVELRIDLNFIEPLSFHASQYHFALPLTFPPGTLPVDRQVIDVVNIKCTLHSISQETKCVSMSHDLSSSCKYPTIYLEAVSEIGDPQLDPNQLRGKDFKLSYSMVTDTIFGTLLLQEKEKPPGKQSKPKGSLCLFVSPPTESSVEGQIHRRNIVFLLDRSGSMVGDPFDEATRALEWAISHLNPHDKFSAISFDHRQVLFRNELVHADDAAKNAAKSWITSSQPERGGTDIKTPLSFALGMLDQESNNAGPGPTMHFVFLITDGCVAGEREICNLVKEHCKVHNARILTLGIGTFCNWFFLKMLSQIGRGFSDVVVYKENIFPKVIRLLESASVPVLTDISVLIPGLDNCFLFPFPIPDLFLNAPITIAGSYKGKFPDTIELTGQSYNGAIKLDIKTIRSSKIPVGKILIKQHLDTLTAQGWLDESKDIEQQVVEMSIENSMPSAYTKMVGVEVEDEKDQPADHKLKKKHKGILLAAAAGGAFLVGAAAFSFGDLGASIANSPVDGTIGGLGGGVDGGDCCDCDDCGDCDCAECLVC